MASLCKSQQCSIERRGFRQELDSWRYKLIHCVGFESILEGLFGPGLLKDLSFFEDCEPSSVCDWSFDENCLFCCLRREKVKEHLTGFRKPACEAGPENLLKQEQVKIIRLERQAEEFINAVFCKKDSPRVFDPNIPLVAREIMQRMIRQFAAEYTSKNSSTQDSSQPNSTKNQSLPKSPSGKSSPPPATTQNPVLSKLLMADQDSPLDLTVKKSSSEEPCEQDGVLDLSTKKSPGSGSTYSSVSPSTSNTIGNGRPGKPSQHRPDGLPRSGDVVPPRSLLDGTRETYGHSTTLKVPLARSLQISEELLSRKPFSTAASHGSTGLQNHGQHLILSREASWAKPHYELNFGRMKYRGNGALSNISDLPFLTENANAFPKNSQNKHDVKKEIGLSSPVDLKIPQVRGMDLSWESRSGDLYNYSSLVMGSQTESALSKRLRTILPKQNRRNLLDTTADSWSSDAEQSTSGQPYATSDQEGDPGSKQPRKKRGRYRQYNSEILEEAIAVVMGGKMSVSKAQSIYGIPHSTLEYKVKERLGTLKNPPKKKLKLMRLEEQDIAVKTELEPQEEVETSQSANESKDEWSRLELCNERCYGGQTILTCYGLSFHNNSTYSGSGTDITGQLRKMFYGKESIPRHCRVKSPRVLCEKNTIDPKHSTDVTLEEFMVKLCAHHQKQFIHVLNTFYTEELLSLSENGSTSISQDQFFDLQNGGCACSEKLNCASGLEINKSESQCPTSNHHQVITETETDCTNKGQCPGIVAQYSSEILTVSTISADMSVGSCVTTANCTLYDLHSILFSKDQGNPCIEKVQCQPLNIDSCTKKYVEMCKKCPTSSGDENDCKSDELNSSQCEITNNMANRVNNSENNLLDHIKNSEANSVPLPQNLVLNDDIQPPESNGNGDGTPDLISNCRGQCDIYVNQPKSGSHFESQKTICPENTTRKNVTGNPFSGDCCELPIVHALVTSSTSTKCDERDTTDLEQAPAIPEQPVDSGTALLSLVHEEAKAVRCAISCDLKNCAKEHASEIVKPASKEAAVVENADVSLPEKEHVDENRITESTVSVCIDSAFEGAAVGQTQEPSVDTDINISLETKNMLTDCDTRTQDCEVRPLEKGTETFPIVTRDPCIDPPVSPLMFSSNGIAAPVSLSDLKSQNRSPNRASDVQKSVESEESISGSLSNTQSHGLSGGLSDLDIVPKPTKHMIKPAISLKTDGEAMDKKTIDTIAAAPEKPGHSCSVEAFNKESCNSGIMTPFHKELNITTALNNFDGISVSSAVKDDFNNLLLNYTKADSDICMEIEKNSLNEVKRLDDHSFSKECEESLDSNSINEEKYCERVHSDHLRGGGDIKKIKSKSKKKLKKSLTSAPSDRCLRSRLAQDHSAACVQDLQIHVHNDLKRVVYIKGETNVTLATDVDWDLLSFYDPVDCPDTGFDQNHFDPSSNKSTRDLKEGPERIDICKSSTCAFPKNVKICVDISSEKRKVYIPITKRKGSLNAESRKNDEKSTFSSTRNSIKQRPSKPLLKCKEPSKKRYLRKNKSKPCPMETTVKSELKCTDRETERPKFIDWCSEEESQERISNFSNKYLSVHKNWIPLRKEASIVHKSKNKSDRLKEIWKTKKRARKSKSVVEGQNFSSIQMLFMNSFKLSDVCQWFLETTETKSLVIVKKLNTRLPEDLPFSMIPLHKYPASSLYPHMLQAQRLKKHLKKFASAFPARNNRKTQNALSKLKHNKNVGEDQALKDDGALRMESFRGRKSKTSLNKPASDQILRKYNNIRAKFQHHSGPVNTKQRDTFVNTFDNKIGQSTKMTTHPNSASSRSPESDGRQRKGKRRSKEPMAISDEQPRKKRKTEKAAPGKKLFLGRTRLTEKRESKQLHQMDSHFQSRIPKKQLAKGAMSRTSRNQTLRKRKAKKHEHFHKAQENKIAKRKQASSGLAKSQKKASQLQRGERQKASSRTMRRKKALASQPDKTRQRSRTDSSPRRRRRALDVK
ncbi:ligand-dependent corepressor [Spea bombifrons]|uniref:ligand-dependent corepressor n=1 Tax=Spea bombifrons TaxID=233779 RepID=UPI00234B1605|nr:ligand-dependent corepressor [Spea bombifrons]